MIYTSYFSSKKYRVEDGVSIARYASFWKGDRYKDLYPPKVLLDWWKTLTTEETVLPEYQEQYIKAYTEEVLDKLDANKVATELDGKVLLCYEKSTDFCHRAIVAKWLRDNGYMCEEL